MHSLIFSPEAKLLIELLRAERSGSPVRPQQDRDSAIDWPAFAWLAEREQLLAVVWPLLSASGLGAPAAVVAAVHRHILVSEFRMAAFERELRGAVRLLSTHGVPVMLVKGAALAVTAYGSFAARPMGDLDVLVREAHAPAAWDVLHDAGWQAERRDAGGFYDRHQHLCPLVAPGGANVVLELHRAIVHPSSPFVLPEADLWREARPAGVGDVEAWVPSPEHQLLHLCLHFAWAHSLGVGLGRTIRDIGMLIPSVRWSRVVELARAARGESCCYWTLSLVADGGGVAIPQEVLTTLSPKSARLSRHALERVILADALDPDRAFTPSLRLARLAWEWAIRPAASGHGAARPWTATAGFPIGAPASTPASWSGRMKDQLSSAGRWARYARVLLGLA